MSLQKRCGLPRLQAAKATTTSTASTTVVPWNSRLRELANQCHFAKALTLYRQMLRSGHPPNAFTFPFALKSCAALSLLVTGKLLHGHVVKTGCEPEPFVQTSLISMYCRCSLIKNARRVFEDNDSSRKLTVCYNALISGYTSNSKISDAVLLFRRMREAGLSVNSVTMLGLIPGCIDPVHLGLGITHHQTVEIYKMLYELESLVKELDEYKENKIQGKNEELLISEESSDSAQTASSQNFLSILANGSNALKHITIGNSKYCC
ncbi:hypothetical protein FEM48_Zijuj12G0062800 [Ziziphus jujuba var. spinosa]|uniref:Pentatricopeptide repeat-containing protein n=1 Tax=Ziziphus jujuba var. spinosa TaxID=714518 RepID=A0A978UBN4_ZIZJJ|nr:hypothetical protein FEM48_Zijuj12G0062800 [Ziziphus jujuba var. spinosa]